MKARERPWIGIQAALVVRVAATSTTRAGDVGLYKPKSASFKFDNGKKFSKKKE